MKTPRESRDTPQSPLEFSKPIPEVFQNGINAQQVFFCWKLLSFILIYPKLLYNLLRLAFFHFTKNWLTARVTEKNMASSDENKTTTQVNETTNRSDQQLMNLQSH